MRSEPGRRLLLVHAHPDDETLATGGTIAHYAERPDTAVTLVTCTLGEEGEVIPPELVELAPDRADQLGGYRAGELARACAALGCADHRFLGGAGRWRDSGMAFTGHGVRATVPDVLHPRAFAAPDAHDAQVDALVAVLAEVRPQVVLTYAADGGYGHPDHVRAHEITVAAVAQVPARLYFTVRGRSTLDAGLAELAGLPGMPFRLPGPDELPSVSDAVVSTRVDVRAQRARRIAAMRAHATQIALWSETPGSETLQGETLGSETLQGETLGSETLQGERGGGFALAMSNGVAQPLLDVEEYVESGADLRRGAAGGPATDLFAGVPA